MRMHWLSACGVVLLAGCYGFGSGTMVDGEGPPPAGGGTDAADAAPRPVVARTEAGTACGAPEPTAYPDVQPIFAKYCAGCHASDGWDATCSAAQGNASEIEAKVASGVMPKGGGFPSADKDLLLKWIADGTPCAAPGASACGSDGGETPDAGDDDARDPRDPRDGGTQDSPPDAGGDGDNDGGQTDLDGGAAEGGTCTTSYAAVQPVFASECAGCHGANAWDSTCAAAQKDAPTIGAKVASGEMPLGGGLSATDKDLLLTWVGAGSPCLPTICEGDGGVPVLDAGEPDANEPDAGGADASEPDAGEYDAGGGDAGADAASPDGGTCATTTYAAVRPILSTYCAGCHGSDKWDSSCSAAKKSASKIGTKVASGKMPLGGGLPAADKDLLVTWVSEGALCNAPGCAVGAR